MALFLDIESGEIITPDLQAPHIEPEKLEGTDIESEQTSTGYGDLIPALGYNEFDGHIYVSGATNSGKSFFINKMLLHDRKKRKVYMFTDLKKQDPSFKELFATERLKIVVEKKVEEWEISQSDFRNKVDGSIIVFDDSSDPEVRQLMIDGLLKGRHRKSTIVAVNHKLREWSATKTLLNDAKYIVAFPNSNRGAIIKYLREEFDVNTTARRLIIKQAVSDGRQIIFHRFAPNAVATAKTVFII